MHTRESLKELLNKTATLIVKSGARYCGRVGYLGEDHLILSNLQIINAAGGVTASKSDKTRRFKYTNIKAIGQGFISL
jgi:hypothetical protein